nr:N-acetylmuramoyl-L-alanine amidase [Actinomyces sp.]
MSASRYLRVAAVIPLALVGVGQVAAAQTQPAAAGTAPAPVQLIELTTPSGETTELAEAGLSEKEPGSATDAVVPAGTAEGSTIAPARASLLAAATDVPDLEQEADLLTEPLEVDGFLVAGFTWSGGEELPTGTQIYLRVRENGTWSSWYRNEAADAGPDDVEGNGGTDEFVTGGADAVQAAVVSGGRALPTDLTLALVPAKPAGEEVLSEDDVTTTEAEPTEIAKETAVAEKHPVDRLLGATEPVEPADEAAGSTAPAAASAGHGVNLDLSAALAATTTANSLPVPVVTRAEWGANQAYMTWSPKYCDAAHVVVHHTAGTNNYTAAQSASIVAGIYYYHAVTLDWGDIGYNFLVDKYGQVFEGRYGTLSSAAGKMVVGGHARGANTGTMGISMMGNYVSTSPTDVQLDRVGKMAGWFLKRSGVTNASASASFTILTTEKYKAGQVVNLPRILAHRDVGYTTCPGDAGYSKMGQIRSVAQSQISSGSTGGGSSTPAAPTWRLVDKTWYLYDADGARLTGWQKVNGNWYYLSPVNGAMATGWQAISGKWYYLTGSGAMATGWVEVSGSWYYMSDSGAMMTGWLHLGSTWYYLHPSGAAALGWQLINGTWYYFRPGNAMVVGWAHVNGRWYYLGSSGEMMTGWLSINGTWYYLDRSGAMLTGWQKIGGSWYYLRGSGAMVTGTQLIDGRYSEFAPSGAWKGYISEAEAKGLHLVMAAPTSTRSVTVAKMVAAYQRSGETYPASVLGRGGASTISAFAGLAYDEAAAEGVSPELLFVQAMKETGWLQYGGDVKATQFNFGGLGATGGGNPGNSFASVQIGLRAQVQHLRAYADPTVTTARLAHDVVDPRFSYVKKGSAPYIEYLGTQENPSGAGWATAKGYGTDLMAMVRSHFG